MKSGKQAPTKGHLDISLITVLYALADPVRLEIVRQLDEVGEKACGTFGIDMPKSSLSHHFGILRKSGIIVAQKRGALLMNRLQRKELEAALPGVLDSVLLEAHRRYRDVRRNSKRNQVNR